MRLLDRYLLGQFLLWAVGGLLTFVGLFVIIDLFERIDTFVDYKTPAAIILRYYGYGLTTIITQVLPLALLLGTLLSLGQLRSNNELTAMQASGQSPLRLAAPLLGLAFFFCLIHYYISEEHSASHYAEQKRILVEDIKRISEGDRQSQTNVRLLGGGNRFYVAQYYDAKRFTLRSVSVQFVDPPTLDLRIDAARAVYDRGVWRFEKGFYRSFGDSTEVTLAFDAFASTLLSEVPTDFARRRIDPFRAGMRELWRYAKRVGESGGETQKYMTNFHLRASYPLSGLIMVFLGAGLSMRVVRGNSLVLGIGLSMAVGFAYFSLIRTGQALGYSGTLPPALAAWLGNLVFILIGMIVFRRLAR